MGFVCLGAGGCGRLLALRRHAILPVMVAAAATGVAGRAHAQDLAAAALRGGILEECAVSFTITDLCAQTAPQQTRDDTFAPPMRLGGAQSRAGDLRGSIPASNDTAIRSKSFAADGAASSETAASASFRIGFTTNAGPSFDETASPVLDTAMEFIHVRKAAGQTFAVAGQFNDREFSAAADKRAIDYSLRAALAPPDSQTHQLTPSLLIGKSTAIDEDVTQFVTGLSYVYARPIGSTFLTSSIAYLDYSDIAAGLLEFGNQDDRDRMSITQEAGVSYKISDDFSLKAGLGSDWKIYTEKSDDFGLNRNSRSLFAFAAADLVDKNSSLSLRYSPVYRSFSDPYFGSLIAHTFAIAGGVSLENGWTLSTSATYGLTETDFFDARVVKDLSIKGGVQYAWPGGSVAGIEVIYTLRDFDGYDRTDRELDINIDGRTPLGRDVFLTGRIEYLDFTSPLLGVRTDATLAMLGVAYTFGDR